MNGRIFLWTGSLYPNRIFTAITALPSAGCVMPLDLPQPYVSFIVQCLEEAPR